MDAFVKRLPQADKDDDGSKLVLNCELASERPRKRLKGEEVADSASKESDESSSEGDPTRGNAHDGSTSDDEFHGRSNRPTDVENVLPPTQTDDNAIEKYQLMKSSQTSLDENETTAKAWPSWIKGKSSIYVDSFNLALDTVLEEESQLFDEKETEVFRQWRGLNYEAQYLYVRLFLRKTAAWHRSSRLGYYADVSNPEAAIASLQSVRSLPQPSTLDTKNLIPGLDLEEFELGETFTFADASEDHVTTVDEAASLLYLDELKGLAKEAKVQGRNKAELIKGFSGMSQKQAGLMALGLSRHSSHDSNASGDSDALISDGRGKVRRGDSNREQHFLSKILTILGPCIRLSPLTFKLFERVHLVFYRSTEWTEKSLTTIILAKIARRNFPEYIVCRTSTIFATRMHLLEFEAAIRLEAEVDGILELSGTPSEEDMQKIVDIFEQVYPRWQAFVTEEQDKERSVYEMGEGVYLRRFNPAHSYTRIILKAMFVFGRRKEYLKEYDLLTELLDQRLFHLARRGAWYQRKALLEEHYMPKLDEHAASTDSEQQKKHWKRIAVSTCEAGLQDANCHLIHHYDLQKRLVKLEKKLRIPRRLQHDFGHVRLAEPLEITVEGVQLKRELAPKPGARAASTKTIWLDELDSDGECSVEEMCLSHFRSEGWKGYHAEGGVVRTLFAYLFYDILFLYIPNVFQTAYQTCPLDLHTDAFFPARASEINHRLVEIANGAGEQLLREVWASEHERRTSAVGLNWDFDLEDLAELVRCFEGSALAAICKVMAQEYRHRGGGVPDLLLWRTGDGSGSSSDSGGNASGGPGAPRGEVMFAEVKSANDRLSDTQRLWIHVLTGAGVKVALCNAVAKEVREVD
ncbi:Fanconi-associated nuclease 1-like protein [Tolypocladium ophioglossoides CBS 100239]|uniref:Fanconi-associated nuclease n=1 Tax=Tolypocladium ophioglossoides (strain CBS 100239) TaxID=1163406 RepID=A0A0L0NLD2_TOLOC|nr:Fanconi-associated nuclease 1-like protein [Tolypocladium ophioglossoides CBS 100239]